VRPLISVPVADARALDLSGSMLLVAGGDEGLILVDVSDPAGTAITGSAPMPGTAVDVAVAGNHAYVANQTVGLVVVDISDPAAPVVRGIDNTPGRSVAVAVKEPVVLVADEVNGLRIVNVADPAAPFVVRTVPMPGAAKGVAVDGDVAVVAAREGDLQVVDVRTPAFAAVVGSFPTQYDAIAVAMAGSVAFASLGSGGIVVVDVTQPASPQLLQSIGTANFVSRVAVHSDRLAIAEQNLGARVMDITTPLSPALKAYLAGGDIQSVEPLGDLLVVADAAFGLRVFDPATLSVVGEIAIAGARRLALADSIAYVVDDTGIPVVDLRDPAHPAMLPALPLSGPFDDVAVEGEFVYALVSFAELTELRRDGTGIPRTYSTFGANFPSLTVDDPYIFLPDSFGSLYVINRPSMKLITIVPLGTGAERVVFRRTEGPFVPVVRGWVAERGRATIEVFDFASIMFPQVTGSVACLGNVVDLAFAEPYMAVAEAEDGIEIFEVLGESAARPLGYFPEAAFDVTAFGNRFAVAGGAAGLFLIGFDECLAPR